MFCIDFSRKNENFLSRGVNALFAFISATWTKVSACFSNGSP